MADDLSDITDDELVRRAAAGDQSAWASLADRHLSCRLHGTGWATG